MDQISVFMDGEANRAEAKMTILRLRQSDECQDAWHTFHLIGDALRRDSVLSDGFMTRFSARMESEPLLRAPHLKWRRSVNYALSAAASLAAVAVVLTLVLADNPLRPQMPLASVTQSEAASVAQAPAAQPTPAPPAHRKVNEYLMAHQEFSPSTALQGVAPGFAVRSAVRHWKEQSR